MLIIAAPFAPSPHSSHSHQRAEAVPFIHEVLRRHATCLQGNPFAGLPELTNKDGAACPGSCPSQAWSGAGMVEVIAELREVVDVVGVVVDGNATVGVAL